MMSCCLVWQNSWVLQREERDHISFVKSNFLLSIAFDFDVKNSHLIQAICLLKMAHGQYCTNVQSVVWQTKQIYTHA